MTYRQLEPYIIERQRTVQYQVAVMSFMGMKPHDIVGMPKHSQPRGWRMKELGEACGGKLISSCSARFGIAGQDLANVACWKCEVTNA